MEFFASVEAGALSTWVREYPLAFPSLLVLHALGMGFAAGVGVLVCVRVLAAPVSVSSGEFRALAPIMWIGLGASAFSGVLLLTGYPAKALTNPVFYLKLAFLGLALAILRLLANRLSASGERGLRARCKGWAVTGALCWVGVIAAGRLLAYTHSVLLASHLV